MDWFKGNLATSETPNHFMEKNRWFPVKIFPTKPVHWDKQTQSLWWFQDNPLEVSKIILHLPPLTTIKIFPSVLFGASNCNGWISVPLHRELRCLIDLIVLHPLADGFGHTRYLIFWRYPQIKIHWDPLMYPIWVCLKMGYTPNYSHLVGIIWDNDH